MVDTLIKILMIIVVGFISYSVVNILGRVIFEPDKTDLKKICEKYFGKKNGYILSNIIIVCILTLMIITLIITCLISLYIIE